MIDYKIKELTLDDLDQNMLQNFNRHQEVKKCWRKEAGKWVLRDIAFVEHWDDALKREVVTDDWVKCLRDGGSVWVIFDEKEHVIGFASLLGSPMGNQGQYRNLMQLHISYEHRGEGLGRKLFMLCAEKAHEMGASKLYLSTHSSEETQAFYQKMGCVDALEIDSWYAEHEPCDRQMEYVIDSGRGSII